MLYPSINNMMQNGDNAYSFVIAVAKRAREIANEAKDKDEILAQSPLKLAVNDFAQGRVKIRH